MKLSQPTDFAALVGIDWADRKHDVCLTLPNTTTFETQSLAHKPEIIEQWAMTLKKRFPKQRIAVCCELKKGPLIYALSKYNHLVLFPVNPQTVAKFRKAFSTSGAKDDPDDAQLQCELLAKHMDKLHPLMPQNPKLRALQQLVEYRRRCVADKVQITNRLRSALKNYFPQVLDWFTNIDTIIFCDFLTRWPNLKISKRAHKATLFNFFQNHNARYSNINHQRVNAIKSAVPLTEDEAILIPNQLLVQRLIEQLRVALRTIECFDDEIKTIFRHLADRRLFESFPGAGAVLAPRLCVAFGEQRNRYQSPDEIAKYAGIAPVLERSGKKSWVHWRYACPKFLRQTFVEWAGESVRHSFWANAYYNQQKAKGKPHQSIVRCLAFKWIRIAFRCWKDRKPYDESTYLLALKKRNSPLLTFAAEMN